MKKIIFSLYIIINLVACQSKSSQELANSKIDSTSIIYSDVPISDDLLISGDNSNIDSTKNYAQIFKDPVWKSWKNIFKSCGMQSDLLKYNKAVYLGESNTLGIGTILDEDDSPIFPLNYAFSETEIKQMINIGSSTPCGNELSNQLNLETILKGNLSIVNPSSPDLDIILRNAIANSKKSNFNVKSWQRDNLYLGIFNSLMNDTLNTKKKEYRDALLKEGNVFVEQVIKINGFSAEIALDKKIDSGVEAQLKNGVIANLGDANAKIEIKSLSNNKIKMNCENEFYVFAKYKKGQKK